MSRRLRLVAAGLLAASVILVAAAAAAAPTATKTFAGTGILGEYYTAQSVTGVFTNRKTIPTSVTVLDWQGIVLLTSAAPRMQNGYWGGYWKQTYHLNSWNLGKAGGNTYHLLLPDTPYGGTFTGMLLTEFGPGGNWQNWIDFTVTAG